ncbi:nitrite reductase small subunit NirD [Castellaniella ginsengisoli]|uniref:Nitrite reductase small subunit NirD n=1 Tax=Castellaniella ginsengisoli TaxID=546114 RepID=A0AB39DSU3_9BURK
MKPSTQRRARHAAALHAADDAPRPDATAGATAAPAWQPVCRLDDLIPDAGIAARAHGEQVALFLTEAGPFALDHVDPFSGAAILARGIVGELQGHPVVASPMYKQHFRLDTGACLEDATVRVRRWPLRVDADGVLSIGRPETPCPQEADHAPAATA